MKRKDLLSELRGLSAAGLKERGAKVAEELMKLRFRQTTGQLTQSHRLQILRRELARIKTFLTGMKSAA
jgi:ribosomal protein L29